MATPMTARILDFDPGELVSAYGDTPRFNKDITSRATAQHLARLNAVLQTSIDLPEILRLFNEEISRSVAITGLTFEHKASHYEYALGEINGHSTSYRLQTKEDYLGELTFYRNSQRFEEKELVFLERLIASLVYPLRNGLRYQEAIRSALTDGLTGAGNRISLENVMSRELDLAARYHQPLSILMLDLDHFKSINDSYGHAAGDQVLKSVAQTIRATSRCADMTFRFGGEEFVVLLNKTDAEGATITAERLRSTIAGLSCIYDKNDIPVTISVGIAVFGGNETKEELLSRADKALYIAKANGRNQIIMAEPTTEPTLQ